MSGIFHLPRRIGAVAAVIAISMLGNLRLQASESQGDRWSADRAERLARTADVQGRVFERVGLAEGAVLDADVDDVASDEGPNATGDDNGQFVP
ncbi:MAG TPA: hypothetical protein VFQ54_08225, partial [Thermomicrobiales bacterium]|nr:hypothetical protein [Thermomicrobiales bacterium]